MLAAKAALLRSNGRPHNALDGREAAHYLHPPATDVRADRDRAQCRATVLHNEDVAVGGDGLPRHRERLTLLIAQAYRNVRAREKTQDVKDLAGAYDDLREPIAVFVVPPFSALYP